MSSMFSARSSIGVIVLKLRKARGSAVSIVLTLKEVGRVHQNITQLRNTNSGRMSTLSGGRPSSYNIHCVLYRSAAR